MTARAAVLGCVAAVLAAGCSSGATYRPAPGAAAALQTDVLALTRAAADHNPAATQAAMTRLRADLAAAQQADAISQTRAATIERALTAVAADLTTATTPAPTPAATTTRATPSPAKPTHAPPPPHHHKKHRHGG